MNIDQIIEKILEAEAGYVNHPSDKGGETCWGITVAVARAFGYTGPMQTLPRTLAKKIYLARHWVEPQFDRVGALSMTIAEELADTGVNMGTGTAARFLQEWLTALNLRGKLYPDLVADGRIGSMTLYALKTYLQKRGKEGEGRLLMALRCSQGCRYRAIAVADETQEDFVYGWLGRV
jgi:lysozyme family protein